MWLGQTDAGNDIQLRSPEGVYRGLAFSSDSRTVYFTLDGVLEPGFFKMPILGGVTEKLSDNIRGNFSISPDSKQVVFLRPNSEQNITSLVISNLDGGGERELLSRPTDRSFSLNCLAWSPDSSMIATALVNDDLEDSREIFLVHLRDGRLVQLTNFEWSRVSNLIWQRDGQGLILVGTNKTETVRHLWHVDYPGGTPQRLSHDTEWLWCGIESLGRWKVLWLSKLRLKATFGSRPQAI